MTGYGLDGPGAGMAGGLLAVGVLAWDRWRAVGRRLDSHGDSSWASRRDLRALHADPRQVNGAVIGWDGADVLRLPDEDNLLVFGVQRSGKTSTVIVPTLLSWPGAVVSTSTKEELVTLTGRNRAGRGPAVQVFAPMDSDHGWVHSLGLLPVAWNPLSDVTTSGLSAELADVFTAEGKASHSPHWYHSAANLLTALFLVARHLEGDLGMVLEFLNSTVLASYAVLGTQVGGRADGMLLGFSRTPPEEAGSIISTARAALSLWLDDRVADATAKGSPLAQLDLDSLLTSGGTLYLVAPAEDAERCRPLFTALLGSLLRRATTGRTRQRRDPPAETPAGAGRGRQLRPGAAPGVVRLDRPRPGHPERPLLPRPGPTSRWLRAGRRRDHLEQLPGAPAPSGPGRPLNPGSLRALARPGNRGLPPEDLGPRSILEQRVALGPAASGAGPAPAISQSHPRFQLRPSGATEPPPLGPGPTVA